MLSYPLITSLRRTTSLPIDSYPLWQDLAVHHVDGGVALPPRPIISEPMEELDSASFPFMAPSSTFSGPATSSTRFCDSPTDVINSPEPLFEEAQVDSPTPSDDCDSENDSPPMTPVELPTQRYSATQLHEWVVAQLSEGCTRDSGVYDWLLPSTTPNATCDDDDEARLAYTLSESDNSDVNCEIAPDQAEDAVYLQRVSQRSDPFEYTAYLDRQSDLQGDEEDRGNCGVPTIAVEDPIALDFTVMHKTVAIEESPVIGSPVLGEPAAESNLPAFIPLSRSNTLDQFGHIMRPLSVAAPRGTAPAAAPQSSTRTIFMDTLSKAMAMEVGAETWSRRRCAAGSIQRLRKSFQRVWRGPVAPR
ncbi:hypothetical protein CspeluHIS016_0114800 [Cutaneotrichosporon spelunceum]|uniref:Uncharacterized protein n=1 Tax=Cutaneotrichosporon spelunceum TaxID=1672016 RepID=A0AAD3YAN1_9TREE|nr:hypothetical protein CspeluHIS016_0114800 [Cutaneotrichosporon spelunceum]